MYNLFTAITYKQHCSLSLTNSKTFISTLAGCQITQVLWYVWLALSRVFVERFELLIERSYADKLVTATENADKSHGEWKFKVMQLKFTANFTSLSHWIYCWCTWPIHWLVKQKRL